MVSSAILQQCNNVTPYSSLYIKYFVVFCSQVPQYRVLYDMALEAHDAKKKTAVSKGKFDMFPKTPVSKFVKAAKFGAAFGGLVKNQSSAPAVQQTKQRSGSIAAALKKTANVAMEIGTPAKLSSNVVEVMKKPEGTGTEASDVMR